MSSLATPEMLRSRARNTVHLSFLNQLITCAISFEMLFALFIYSGIFKGDVRFAVESFDYTFVLGAVSVLWAASQFAMKNVRIATKQKRSVLLAIVFFSWMIVSSQWGPANQFVTRKVWFQIPTCVIALGIAGTVIASDYRRLTKFFNANIMLAAWVSIEVILGYRRTTGFGETTFSTDYLGLGRLVGVAAIITFAPLFLSSRQKSLTELLTRYVLLAMFSFAILILGGRQTAFGLVIILFLALLCQLTLPPAIRIQNRRSTFTTFLIVVGGIVLVSSFISKGYRFNTIDRSALLLERASRTSSIRTRYSLFAKAWDTGKDRPIIGHGAGGFGRTIGIVNAHPHNTPLEVFYEGGLVGVFLLGVLLVYVVHDYKRFWVNEEVTIGATKLFLVVFGFSCMLVSSSYAEERGFFATLGLMASVSVPGLKQQFLVSQRPR